MPEIRGLRSGISSERHTHSCVNDQRRGAAMSADRNQIIFTTTDDEVMVVDVAPDGSTLRIAAPRLIVRTLATFEHRAVVFDAPRSRILLRDLAETVERLAIHVVVRVRAALRVRSDSRWRVRLASGSATDGAMPCVTAIMRARPSVLRQAAIFWSVRDV
jgi:hypothetical protein